MKHGIFETQDGHWEVYVKGEFKESSRNKDGAIHAWTEWLGSIRVLTPKKKDMPVYLFCETCAREQDTKKPSADTVERARIVKYLRSVAAQYEIGDAVPQCDFTSDAYLMAADEIEAGAHREKPGAL